MNESIEAYKERINALQEAVSKAKEEKIRDETNLEQAMKRRDEIIEKMADMGYTPENIEEGIKKKTKTLDGILLKLEEEVLPALETKKDVIF